MASTTLSDYLMQLLTNFSRLEGDLYAFLPPKAECTFLAALGALLSVVARVPLVVRDLLLAEVAHLLGRRLVPGHTVVLLQPTY